MASKNSRLCTLSSLPAGYSSFVNIVRKREIDLTFLTDENKLIYAQLIFDTPEWDNDYLRVWENTLAGERVLINYKTVFKNAPQELGMIQKLLRLVSDVSQYVKKSVTPKQEFPDLAHALYLQQLLNAIEEHALTNAPIMYIPTGKREFTHTTDNWERLG